MRRETRQEIFAFAVLFLTAFLVVSLYTARSNDALLEGFFSSEIKNAGGPLGALAAHGITAWLGTAASYCLILILGSWGLALLFRLRVKEPVWKIVGSFLFLIAISTFEVALSGQKPQFDMVPGGYYGQFCYEFLFSHLERFGAYLMIFFTLLVALLVSTDTLFSPAIARAGQLIRNRESWRAARFRFSRFVPAIRLPRLPEAIARRIRALRTFPTGETIAGERPMDPAAPDSPFLAGDASQEGSSVKDLQPEPAAQEGGSPDSAPYKDHEEDQRPPIKINIPDPPSVQRSIPAARQASHRLGNYKLPPIDLLNDPEPIVNPLDRTILEQTARKIEETLRNFKIDAQVVEVQKGPVITQYEVSLAAGIKVHKIIALSDDLAMALKAASIRIVAPLPGKSTVGVEVPNRHRSMVGLRELIESQEFRKGSFKIPLLLGKDTAGMPIIGDLGEMPHLLIAGSTGSGKSVCINSVITNILLTKTPEEVKLILVDPKMVELTSFEEIPHLLTPVLTDMKKAPAVLNWLVDKMDERYELLSLAGVRNITSYNSLGREKLDEILRARGEVEEEAIPEIPDLLPHYVMIIDELADLMMTASKEVEGSITRLSQKSRAVGIHIVVATQRPSVDVITGLIKANMPSRISFKVASKVDSRTILDRNGADKLLGKGDLLYLAPGTSDIVRAQGTFISDGEIRKVVKYVRNEAEPHFNTELSRFGTANTGDEAEDALYEDAVRIILDSQRGSVTLLQRQLQIGYTRASRLMELMHENGLVGPFKGSKAREVYYKLEEWELAKKKANKANQKDGQAGAEESRSWEEGE